MDHLQAQGTKASERYLLGEMSEPERFEFESHYFDCVECAADVRAGESLARGVKGVCAEGPAEAPSKRRGWFAWLAPGAMAPSAVAAGLAVVAAYQGWIVIPGLRSQTGSRAMAPVVLRPAARGEEQVLEIRRDRPVSLLSLDVNNADPGTPLTYEVIAPGGAARITDSTQAPPPGSQLIVILSNTEIQPPGAWMLVLRTKQGAEVARYPFAVQLK